MVPDEMQARIPSHHHPSAPGDMVVECRNMGVGWRGKAKLRRE